MILSLLLQTKAELRARVGRPQTSQSLPVIYCWPSQGGSFGFLMILDVVCRYLSLFLKYINIKIGENIC